MKKFFLVIFFNLPLITIYPQSSWTQKSSLPVSRIIVTSFAIGNYVYIGNGLTGHGLSSEFWKYDTETDTWIQIESMPTIGLRGAFSFVIEKKAYVGGGLNQNAYQNSEFWEYNSETNEWTRKTDIPSGLIFDDTTTLGFSIGSKGYFLAPFNRANFYLYAPETDTWSKLTNFPGLKAGYQISFVIADKAYVGSGHGIYDYLNEFWEYNPNTDQWTQKSNTPGQARLDAVGFSIGSYGYFGLGTHRTSFLFDFWTYDPVNDFWIQVESCYTAQSYPIGVATESKGYAGAGWLFSNDSGWWEFAPKTSSSNDLNDKTDLSYFINSSQDLQLLNFEPFINCQFMIWSSDGRILNSGIIKGSTIRISDLPSGVFFLQIKQANQLLSVKFIKP